MFVIGSVASVNKTGEIVVVKEKEHWGPTSRQTINYACFKFTEIRDRDCVRVMRTGRIYCSYGTIPNEIELYDYAENELTLVDIKKWSTFDKLIYRINIE